MKEDIVSEKIFQNVTSLSRIQKFDYCRKSFCLLGEGTRVFGDDACARSSIVALKMFNQHVYDDGE